MDVCLSVYGTLDYIYKLIIDSGIKNVDYVCKTGDIFLYDENLIVNNNSVQVRGVKNYATIYIDKQLYDFSIVFNNDFL